MKKTVVIFLLLASAYRNMANKNSHYKYRAAKINDYANHGINRRHMIITVKINITREITNAPHQSLTN